jgi:chromate transporter
VSVVAQAVWGMGRTLCPDRLRASLAVGAAVVALTVPSALGQVGAIAAGGLLGWRWLGAGAVPPGGHLAIAVPRALAVASLVAFVVLLAGLPVLAHATGAHAIALFDRFYRAGSLVFGGGHVVLPLLQQAVVPPGWIANDGFLAGYGVAQAVPGPLFTFAAYLGAAMQPAPSGIAGAALCLVAIYLPSFLLLVGVLPFWDALRRRPAVQAALRGVNAAVVGLLLAALYSPVWTSAIGGRADFALAALAFLALAFWKLPPWLVVGLGAAAAAGLG